MPKFEEVEHNIHVLRESVKDWQAGWYFEDETEQFHGPFGTIEEARELLAEYIKTL